MMQSNHPTDIGPYGLEILEMDMTAWREVLRRARARSREISDLRLPDPEVNKDWHRLNKFEYQHFYSAWIAVAFRFKACTIHNQDFTEAFQKTSGVSRDIDLLYEEDDALFDFFVKGLSALESFYYSLYALGALIRTPMQAPCIRPPDQFPLLDPEDSRKLEDIKPRQVLDAFKQEFPDQPFTEHLDYLLRDTMYKDWRRARNLLAHRVAIAGRTIQESPSQSSEPISVRQWGGDLLLNATMTASRYDWLRKTIKSALEQAAIFTTQQLVYTENQLRLLMW